MSSTIKKGLRENENPFLLSDAWVGRLKLWL